jgi:hypothetical protein
MSGSLTIAEARDEILKVFLDAWPSQHVVRYSDAPGDPPADTDDPAQPIPTWARVDFQHGPSALPTLGPVGGRRFTRSGFVQVQIFTPVGQGSQEADELVQIVMSAFENTTTPGGAWFFNVYRQNSTRSVSWLMTTVVAEFEYYEVK